MQYIPVGDPNKSEWRQSMLSLLFNNYVYNTITELLLPLLGKEYEERASPPVCWSQGKRNNKREEPPHPISNLGRFEYRKDFSTIHL